MSSNLESMPGCAGTLKPISEWKARGLTCLECAWEVYCSDYFQVNGLQANVSYRDSESQIQGHEPVPN